MKDGRAALLIINVNEKWGDRWTIGGWSLNNYN